jgi:phytoene synthase
VFGQDRGEPDLPTSAELNELYAEAASVTAQHSKSFYFATRFFPKRLAQSAHAVYWFCRHTDDLVDECPTLEDGRRDLEAWARQVEGGLRGEPVEHPVLVTFLDAVKRHAIPHQYPLELIEGMRMDLEKTRYRTFEELRVFCYRVASVVGLMMTHVIGFRGDALKYAEDLGIAMQLTNILRDLGEDLDRGRIYLPADEMERFGYSEEDFRNRVRNDAFRELMQFQVERARRYYAAAEPGIALLSSDGRFAVKVASDVYRGILRQIERSEYDVFEQRAFVPASRKYWITARCMTLPIVQRGIAKSSLATLVGLVPHYLSFYLLHTPLWTETIAEWIMARTPSYWAVPLLATLGAWAKPLAMTGALATLGFAVFLTLPLRWVGPLLAALLLGWAFDYHSWIGQLSFWVPVAWMVTRPVVSLQTDRRRFLTSAVMSAGVAVVALESYVRNEVLSRRAVEPIPLFPFHPPPDNFARGLVRKAVTPVAEFYGMSKDSVDPAIDPETWRLKITAGGRTLKEYKYSELLSLPRTQRYVTLRCVSNTLKSDLMGTAAWSGLHLSQLVDRSAIPAGTTEVAIVGVDGHGDSLSLDYAFADETLLALGMNGKTLDRTHGFPLRLLAPRYYGFKNVKWIAEINFVARPYFGTWPRMGYTKEPAVHIASHIDQIRPTSDGWQIGGVSFAGTRGIRAVEVRAGQGPWIPATLDRPLSPFTWTRWYAVLPATNPQQIEARAMDGSGHWQEAQEGPLFPNGVTGPTVRRIG